VRRGCSEIVPKRLVSNKLGVLNGGQERAKLLTLTSRASSSSRICQRWSAPVHERCYQSFPLGKTIPLSPPLPYLEHETLHTKPVSQSLVNATPSRTMPDETCRTNFRWGGQLKGRTLLSLCKTDHRPLNLTFLLRQPSTQSRGRLTQTRLSTWQKLKHSDTPADSGESRSKSFIPHFSKETIP
jgi:hypothetical protein